MWCFLYDAGYNQIMFSIQQSLFGKRLFDKRVYLFVFAVAGLLGFDALAIYFSWYWVHWWLDIPVHMVGGLILALLFYYMVFANHRTRLFFGLSRNKQSIFSTMVFWVLVVAIGWEALELWAGRSRIAPNYALDLFLDIVTTTVGALFAYVAIRCRRF